MPISNPGGGATKEFFVPVTHASGGATECPFGDFPCALLNATNDSAHIAFKVPHDFTSIIKAEILVNPRKTEGAAEWGILSDYGAEGEAATNHSESDILTTYNVTLNILFAVDISTILSALAAHDLVGIMITQLDAGGTHDLDVLGIRFVLKEVKDEVKQNLNLI